MKDKLKDEAKDTMKQAPAATSMGLIESIKQSIQGWVNMASIYQSMLLNTFFVVLGLTVAFLGSGLAPTVGGGIAILIGLFGLFNNVRFIA